MSERMTAYLDSLCLAPEVLAVAHTALAELQATLPYLLEPDAAPCGEGLLFTWDRGAYHAELEILPDSLREFYCAHREASTHADTEWVAGTPIPPSVLPWLQLFHTGEPQAKSQEFAALVLLQLRESAKVAHA